MPGMATLSFVYEGAGLKWCSLLKDADSLSRYIRLAQYWNEFPCFSLVTTTTTTTSEIIMRIWGIREADIPLLLMLASFANYSLLNSCRVAFWFILVQRLIALRLLKAISSSNSKSNNNNNNVPIQFVPSFSNTQRYSERGAKLRTMLPNYIMMLAEAGRGIIIIIFWE